VDTPWKAYVQGDNTAISQSAKKGALLFFRFYPLAVPQVGPGKDDGVLEDDDFGRYRVTHENRDKYAFRTPSLLNVEVTGPYGHSGAFDTLEGITRYHINPEKYAKSFDFSKLDPAIERDNAKRLTKNALRQYKIRRAFNKDTLRPVELDDGQINDLVQFMLTLTDPRVKDRNALSLWIPDESDSDPDGLRQMAVDENGNPL
jgi:cytochrome c peroxidase